MLRIDVISVFLCVCVFVSLVPVVCLAGPQSLFAGTALGATREPLLQSGQPILSRAEPLLRQPVAAVQVSLREPAGGSLFSGRRAGSLLAPITPRAAKPTREVDVFSPFAGGPIAQLRSLIAKAEAGRKGYDAVQHGARVKPRKAPTSMTIQEIYAWIDDTPGQPHAIGRYQFIPKTLRRLVKQLGVPETARFTPQVQDLLADRLLEDAGLSQFLRGEKSQTAFMNGLARIWAGLPNSSGKSHYHGYAGNKATMTWTRFNTEMSRIFSNV